MQHSNPAPDSSIRLTWTVIFCLYFAGADNQRIYWISRDWSVDTSVLLSYAQKDERCLFKALHWPVPGLAIVFFFYLKMNLQLLERETNSRSVSSRTRSSCQPPALLQPGQVPCDGNLLNRYMPDHVRRIGGSTGGDASLSDQERFESFLIII